MNDEARDGFLERIRDLGKKFLAEVEGLHGGDSTVVKNAHDAVNTTITASEAHAAQQSAEDKTNAAGTDATNVDPNATKAGPVDETQK